MQCAGCGADVSVLRDVCPKCGTPTDRVFGEHHLHDPRRSEPGGRPPEELKRNRKTALTVAAGVLILLAAAGKFHPFGPLSFSGGHVRIDPRVVTNEAVTIGAAQLFEAYHTNSQAADRRFGGRQMVVTGEFVRTVPDGYGSIDMRLKTAHPDLPLGIDLDNHSVDAATKLEPGQMVTVSCRRVAGTGDDPWLQDCVLQPPAPGEIAKAPETAPPAPPAASQR